MKAPMTSSPSCRDVRDFGAKPGDGKDDSAAIQKCIDAGPGLVYLPGWYELSAPLNVRGRGVRLFGDGVTASGLKSAGTYAGPLVTVGVTPPPQGQYRPPVPKGTYDSSVAGPRYALSTLGQAAACGIGLPLQFGGSAGQPPDYYQGRQTLTIDLYLAPGGTYRDGQILAGIRRRDERGGPWQLTWRAGAVWLAVNCPDGVHEVPGGASGRLTWAVNLWDGYGESWCERRQVCYGQQLRDGSSSTAAGQQMAFPDGFGPFSIGGGNGSCTFTGADFAGVSVYGLRVVRGDPYVRSSAVQALAGGRILTDQLQFFDGFGDSCLGVLPLTDSGPTVAVDTSVGRCLLHLIGPAAPEDTQDVGIERLGFQPRMQPAVLIGQHFGLSLDHVSISGGSQSVACLGMGEGGYGQSLSITDAFLDGTDSPLVLVRQLDAQFNRVRFGTVGRHAVRARGGDMDFSRIFLQRTSTWTRSFVYGEAEADGQRLSLRRFNFDNEDRPVGGPNFEFLSGGQRRSLVTIDTGMIAQGSDQPFARLVGLPTPDGWAPSRLTVSGVDCAPLTGVAVQADGPCWVGAIDAAGLGSAKVGGDNAAGVVVRGGDVEAVKP